MLSVLLTNPAQKPSESVLESSSKNFKKQMLKYKNYKEKSSSEFYATSRISTWKAIRIHNWLMKKFHCSFKIYPFKTTELRTSV